MIKRASPHSLASWRRCPVLETFPRTQNDDPDLDSAPLYLLDAGERGIVMHARAEQYLRRLSTLHPILGARYYQEFLKLRSQNPLCEHRVQLTESWTPAFTKEDARIVGVFDALVLEETSARVIDYKVGQAGYTPDRALQGDMYAALVFAAHTNIERVHVEFWFVEMAGLHHRRVDEYTPDDTRIKRVKYLVRKFLAREVLEYSFDFAPPTPYHCIGCYKKGECPNAIITS